jgi:hypothetical protein
MEIIANCLNEMADSTECIGRTLSTLGGSEVQHLSIPSPVYVTDQGGLQYRYLKPADTQPDSVIREVQNAPQKPQEVAAPGELRDNMDHARGYGGVVTPACMRPTEGPTGQSTTKSQQAAERPGMGVGALKKHAKGGGGPKKACGKPSTPN